MDSAPLPEAVLEGACVASSDAITTIAEARAYYKAKLVGAHKITSKNSPIDIVFEADGTHLFSVTVKDIYAIPADQLVTRNIGGGKRECRQFDLDRARLMDRVLPTISTFTLCVSGGNGSPSRAPRLIHGPKMACGRHMRVVLRRGAGKSWVVLSGYPVTEQEYRKQTWVKPIAFP